MAKKLEVRGKKNQTTEPKKTHPQTQKNQQQKELTTWN